MATSGIDYAYQYVGHIGNMKLECGDPTYVEVSTRKCSISTTLSHIVFGFFVPDGSICDTVFGRGSSRVGEPSAGVLCFSMADNTITAADSVTYMAIGW